MHPSAVQRQVRLPISFLLLVTTSLALRGETIWIEGEDATRRKVTPHSWYDDVKKDVLSGGKWLSHFDRAYVGEAEFELRIPTTGAYTLWVRANHVKSTLSVRVDDDTFEKVDFDRGRRGELNIARDNKPDLRFLSWVKVERYRLKKGPHTVSFRMESSNNHHGAIDCLVLTDDGFIPTGSTKPEARAVASPETWFAVVDDEDSFDKRSFTDMSHLVEAPAGKYGFLQAKGAELRFENSGTPVKFWGVGANLERGDDEALERRARWLRKQGINAVRQHTLINAVGFLDEDGNFAPGRLDRYDRWFAALKRHGIYSVWSVVYPHHGAFVRLSDGVDPKVFDELDRLDEQHDGRSAALVSNDYINLDRSLQDHALRYFRALLKHTNPHTGLRYRDDPALAVVEFQNESNVFFHTLNRLASEHDSVFARRLRRGFFDFTQKRYGKRQAVEKAWDGHWHSNDRWDENELALMAPYHWGADGPVAEFKGATRRCADYLEYLAGVQRAYYERRGRELRKLGFRGVTVTTAWKGVGASSAPNLFCDAAADMIDRHDYFGGGDGRHRIVEGRVDTTTHLDRPGRGLLDVGLFQLEDRPFSISEWTMMPPDPWKVEAAPLIAFYGLGLQGWDASYHFVCNGARLGDGWPGLGKYATATPHYIGQFPALATAVHRGHVSEGGVIARRVLTRPEIFSGRDTLGQSVAEGDHDIKELGEGSVTPPEALAAGRVTVKFGDDDDVIEDLARYWNRERGVITSTTGELEWDVKRRVVEVRTEHTQAVIGFAADRTVTLPDVKVRLATPFVSLIFTPLDERPLRESGRILVTALARDRQQGSKYSDDGRRLEVVGEPPLLLEPVQASIRIDGKRPREVRPLDLHGVPRETLVPLEKDGSFRIDGRWEAFRYGVWR